MTECERIVQQGILPKSFFEPETICDFYVDEKRKKIWAVELDLLLEFDRVCKKHGLRYFLDSGTLLGAVRHKGFIPWDDDIDVSMIRNDYEKFLSLASEFKQPYFLQSPYTDKGYFFSYARIRNSNTTGVSKKLSFNEFNQGIYIDVFPLDYVNDSYTEDDYKRVNELASKNSTFMRMNNPFLNDADKKRVLEYDGSNPLDTYEEIQQMAKKYAHDVNCSKISKVVFTGNYGFERRVFPKTAFERNKELIFQGYYFPVPLGYKEVLKTIFDDYMKLPPIEKRGQWHEGCIFEPDIPYQLFLQQNKNKIY